MNGKEVQDILIEILSSAVNEVQIDASIKEKLTPDILADLYCLAKRHDLAHILSNFVFRNNVEVNPELLEKLQRDEFMSVYRCEQMKYAFEEICRIFDEKKIAYIPLKGTVIRPYYPLENMRTSCDIDILIHETDLETAISSLVNRGYICKNRNYHDVLLCSPNKIHLELHFNIQENIDQLDVVLKDAWKYAILLKNSQYEFQNKFFVFHIYAHMAYHFLSGGCGIRSLMDIWIMEHKMNLSYLCAEKMLKKSGIYQFAVEISNIANKCFTSNDRDTFSVLVLNYIFSGGVYGNAENHIAVKKSKKNSFLIYALNRLFLPYKYMIISYPILKKAPYLLLFCWIARCIKAIFQGKSKRIVLELTYANNMSDNKIAEVREIRSRLGL